MPVRYTSSTIRTLGWQAGLHRLLRPHGPGLPGKSVRFVRSFAEGNHVILHCHQIWPGGLEYAGIDIFRLNDQGRVVEHWDVLQVPPEQSQNPNGMF